MRDIRVLHPSVSKESRARAYSEGKLEGHSDVPETSRAKGFRVVEPSHTFERFQRRPVREPPLRLGGRTGGEGAAGAKAVRWKKTTGQPHWSTISAPDEASPAVLLRLKAKNNTPFGGPDAPPFQRMRDCGMG